MDICPAQQRIAWYCVRQAVFFRQKFSKPKKIGDFQWKTLYNRQVLFLCFMKEAAIKKYLA